MYDVYAVVTCLLLLLSEKDKRWLLCPYSDKQTAIPRRMMKHLVQVARWKLESDASLPERTGLSVNGITDLLSL